MTHSILPIVVIALTAGIPPAAVQAQDRPPAQGSSPLLGAADFHPSAERPVGERGDWTGLFPGANGVALEWDHRTGKNIVWKCRMPNWSNSAPIVVGKRAFVGSEPDELVCVDTEKGVVLWKKSIFTDQFIPSEDREGVRKALREANDEAMATDIPGPWPAKWLEATKPAEDPAMAETAKRIAEVRERLKSKGLLKGKIEGTVDAGILSREGEALLVEHNVLIKRKDKASGAQTPFFHGGWSYHIGFTMPSPASDGTHVWYQTSLGAIACLDLEGKIVWCKRIPTVGPTCEGKGFYGGGSPVLIKDKLYYLEGGYVHVAVDKNSGKEVWRCTPGGVGGRGSSGVAPLRLEGKDFLVSPGKFILDPATGATVGDMNLPIDARRAHAISGNSLIYVGAANGNWVAHVRLGLEDDKVTADVVWKIIRGTTWNSAVIYNGNMYMPKGMDHRPLGWYPMEKPKGVAGKDDKELPRAYEIPAAKCFFTAPRTADEENQGAADPWQYSTAAVAEGHLFVGDDKNGMQVFKLDGEKSTVVRRNFMDLWIRANPFFQSHRMYVRSMHYLYCIARTP